MDDFDDGLESGEALALSEYPLDTNGLGKGSRVTAEQIEQAFGISRATDEYRLRMLRVRDYITARLAERGELVTIISDGFDLAILTDEEASAYNARRFEVTRRAGERAFVRLGQVDRGKLSVEAVRRHDRDLVTIGRRIQADHAAEKAQQRLPKPKPYKRDE